MMRRARKSGTVEGGASGHGLPTRLPGDGIFLFFEWLKTSKASERRREMRVWCKCVWRCGCGEEVGAGVVTVDFVVPRRACACARASDVRGETHSRVFVHTPLGVCAYCRCGWEGRIRGWEWGGRLGERGRMSGLRDASDQQGRRLPLQRHSTIIVSLLCRYCAEAA